MPDKKQPAIPTADQEALQAPAIDPTMTAGIAMSPLGPAVALKNLFQQVLLNAIVPNMPMVAKLPVPAPAEKSLPKLAMDYAAYKSRMTPSGIPYRFLQGAEGWLRDKMLAQKPGSMMDKAYSTVLEKMPDWYQHAKKYAPSAKDVSTAMSKAEELE